MMGGDCTIYVHVSYPVFSVYHYLKVRKTQKKVPSTGNYSNACSNRNWTGLKPTRNSICVFNVGGKDPTLDPSLAALLVHFRRKLESGVEQGLESWCSEMGCWDPK